MENNLRLSDKQYELTILDNNAEFDFHPIYYGITISQAEIGKTPDENDYLENALHCLRLIKNYHRAIYGFTGTTDNNGELCLPIFAEKIVYVTDGEVDWVSISPNNQTSQLYAPGNYVHYKFLGDRIQTSLKTTRLSVCYKTFLNDEEFPLVTTEEARACAYWWNFIDVKRKVYQGNSTAMQLLPLAEKDKNKYINQARVSMKFSQNFMNQWGDLIFSRNRKNYNLSYKPVKI